MLICILLWNLSAYGCQIIVWQCLGQVGSQSLHPSSFSEGTGVHHHRGQSVTFEKQGWIQVLSILIHTLDFWWPTHHRFSFSPTFVSSILKLRALFSPAFLGPQSELFPQELRLQLFSTSVTFQWGLL